jgi:hypothetical protein
MAFEAFAVGTSSGAVTLRTRVLRFKVLLHHGVHVALVGLEAEYVVCAARVQLCGNAFLAADGIYGDDAALQVQHLQ